ncbi:MAG: Rv3654c family TadE-like protein [Actinomycetota bacterium]
MSANGERGSVTVVVAAILTGVLVLGLGAADLARVLATAGRARTAADASALAAAQELVFPSGPAPGEIAATYANHNGAGLDACSCEPGSAEVTVRVWVPVGPLLLFGDDRVVHRTARAEVVLPPPEEVVP